MSENTLKCWMCKRTRKEVVDYFEKNEDRKKAETITDLHNTICQLDKEAKKDDHLFFFIQEVFDDLIPICPICRYLITYAYQEDLRSELNIDKIESIMTTKDIKDLHFKVAVDEK